MCAKLTSILLRADAAEYAELPLIPPFLQPNADFSNGVNFASGGAGVLSETNNKLVNCQHHMIHVIRDM